MPFSLFVCFKVNKLNSIQSLIKSHNDDVDCDSITLTRFNCVLIFFSCHLFRMIVNAERYWLIFQVVQEYERAVIFRLGRLMQGGAKGPGISYSAFTIFVFNRSHVLQLNYCRHGNKSQSQTLTIAPVWFIHLILYDIRYLWYCGAQCTIVHGIYIYSCNLHIFCSAGIFFILPCVDAYARVDLRTRTYDVPPQEVCAHFSRHIS